MSPCHGKIHRNTRLNERILLKVDTGCVTATTFQNPGILIPVGLVVIHPAVVVSALY